MIPKTRERLEVEEPERERRRGIQDCKERTVQAKKEIQSQKGFARDTEDRKQAKCLPLALL